MQTPVITAFDWVPDFARGQVRDLRVRWALEEIGRPYTVRYLSQGQQKQPDHRARQPYGQVPTYEDGAVTLYESGAIVLHLAEGTALLPTDPAARAQALEWSFSALNTVEPPIMDQAIATLFEADKPWSAPRLPAIEARIRGRLAETAARLDDREWYRDTFSAGDLLMVAVLRILRDDPLLAEQPTLAAYVARGEARPAFQRALADQLAGFTGAPPPEFAAWLEQQKQREGETA
ncbi:glutathione S-transferase family protein [Sphingomonas adhaesiva]|uniref:glutathione S-transferase family protein n=1 Tax=Sphingomonas adhaesiva TaxID=28212 RepID=UPI002FF84EE3